MDQQSSQHRGVTTVCGPFTASKAWAYWVVTGPVPLEVARELFADALGRKVVRVGGYAGNIDPQAWLARRPWKTAIDTYHIDTDEGFQLFNATLRKHGLV